MAALPGRTKSFGGALCVERAGSRDFVRASRARLLHDLSHARRTAGFLKE